LVHPFAKMTEQTLLELPVKKVDEVIGEKVEKEIAQMKDGDLLMLENVRFHNEETECEEEFTKKLASLGEIFVNDAFGTAHRRHASTAGLADHLPAYGGMLIEKEVNCLSPLLDEEPVRPITMVFGGAKIDTKIGVIKNFIHKADYFLIGGGLANTFLHAAGYEVGQSLCQNDRADIAREIMMECEKEHKKLILPKDVIVASEVSEDAETTNVPVQDVEGDMKIFDIGKWTAEKFCNIILESGTVIWNGPVGLSEYAPFKEGSHQIGDTIAKHNCYSIIGGGDTVECIKRLNIPIEAFTHVSTGGGACVEFLEGKKLPGIEILRKK